MCFDWFLTATNFTMHVHYNSGPFFHYYQFTRVQTDYYYTVTCLMLNCLLASKLASTGAYRHQCMRADVQAKA